MCATMLPSQVHAWVESHQSTLSVLPTTASRWCRCCHPSWGTSICHWHHRYQTFSLICVPAGLFSTLLALHPKLTGWIRGSQALQISLKKYIKILMPADWEIISDHIVLFSERSETWCKTRYYSLCSLAYAINGLPLRSLILRFPSLLRPGSQTAWHSTIKKCLEHWKKKQNCPLKIGKCSARHQLTEHQTRMSEVINNLRQSFVWVGYIA